MRVILSKGVRHSSSNPNFPQPTVEVAGVEVGSFLLSG